MIVVGHTDPQPAVLDRQVRGDIVAHGHLVLGYFFLLLFRLGRVGFRPMAMVSDSSEPWNAISLMFLPPGPTAKTPKSPRYGFTVSLSPSGVALIV